MCDSKIPRYEYGLHSQICWYTQVRNTCDFTEFWFVKHKYLKFLFLSAYGMALADVIHEEQEPCALEYNENNKPQLFQTLGK